MVLLLLVLNYKVDKVLYFKSRLKIYITKETDVFYKKSRLKYYITEWTEVLYYVLYYKVD